MLQGRDVYKTSSLFLSLSAGVRALISWLGQSEIDNDFGSLPTPFFLHFVLHSLIQLLNSSVFIFPSNFVYWSKGKSEVWEKRVFFLKSLSASALE